MLLAADEGPDEAAALTATLEGIGLSVTRQTPGELSDERAALSNYDSLILVDVNAQELSMRQMSAVQSYVPDVGGGLLVVGGPASYGVGAIFAHRWRRHCRWTCRSTIHNASPR